MASQPQDFNFAERAVDLAFCIECNEDPPNICVEFASGDCVCRSCGLVVKSGLVDTRSEWRTFQNDDKSGPDPNRVGKGADPLLSGDQLFTRIGGANSSSTYALSLAKSQRLASGDRSNEKLAELYGRIDAYCAFGKLTPTIAESSKHIAKLSVDGKWFRAFPEEVVCALIFEGCKRAGEPRNIKEVSRLSGKQVKINKCISLVNRQLTLGAGAAFIGASRAIFAKDLMPRYCQALGLPVWAESISVRVAEAVNDTLILGARSARNVATTVVYLVCHLIGQPRKLSELQCLAEQAKSTLRRSIKLLYDQREQIVKNPHWPVDDRINTKLLAGLMDAEWFSRGLPSAGLGHKVSSGPPATGGELVPVTVVGPTPNGTGSLSSPEGSSLGSSQGTSQGTTQGFDSSSSSSWMFSTQETPNGSQTSTLTLAAPESTDAPPAKKRKTLRNTEFQPGLGQKICVWNGLFLPGPMVCAMNASSQTSKGVEDFRCI